MRTLYLRNVPDEVVERLERLAERESMSVNAVAVRELAESTKRLNNAALLEGLPNLNISIQEILEDLDRGRADR
jgi:predicted transcriptional regulator